MDPIKSKSLASLTIEDFARLLTISGTMHVTTDMIKQDIALGAPVNPDGTMNFIDFLAWMLEERNQGRDRSTPPPPIGGAEGDQRDTPR